MKYEEIRKELQLFDDFMNKAISSNIDKINIMEVVTAYNKLRNFINKNLEKDE